MEKMRLRKLFLQKNAAVRQACRQGLVLVFMLVTCTWGYARAQGKQVSLDVKNAALREVLQQIRAQAGVKFVYSDVEIQKGKPVTVSLTDESVQTALERILAGQPFVFEIESDVVIVKPVKQQTSAAPQEQRTITGVVVDAATGLSLPGANVFDARTHKGTVTDIDGKFSLRVSADCRELTVSFLGYETVKASIVGRDEIKVGLKEEATKMDEVVVTGVQTIEKGRATGSFSLLKQEDMKNIYSTSLTEKLEGAVPGLYVDKNNEITIRGVSTLNANTKPLIVVDGFPMESSELNLNPNDIEQVTVLKDAASASIWGIRATNGVVVVTTKRGSKVSPLSVSYSGNVTYSGAVDLKDLHVLSSDEFVKLKFETTMVEGVADYMASFGKTEIEKIYSRYDYGEIELDEAYEELAKLGKFNNQKQIEENFYRHAFTQQHNISVSAGGERSRTYVSLSYDQNKSELVGNEYSKYNLLANNDIDLRKNLTVSLGLRATHQYSKRNGMDMTEYEPWKRILNDDGSYYWEQGKIDEEYAERCEELGMKSWLHNPLREMRMNDKKTKSYNVSSSLKIAWKPIEGLEISTQGNYEFGNTEDIDWYAEDHWVTRELVNRFTEVMLDEDYWWPETIVKHNIPAYGGIKDIVNEHLASYSVRNIISYQGETGDFNYKVMAGNEFYSLEGEHYNQRLWGYNPYLMTSQSVNLAELQEGVTGYDGDEYYPQELWDWEPDMGGTLERYTSYFGTASVTYKDRYDLFGSIRLDQTNLLTNASKFRNNPSWSIGAKWHLANEKFFHSEKVNDLGIRLSYGLTGNIDKSTGPSIVAVARTNWDISSLNYLRVTNPANPALGWEKTNSLNIGMNAVLWDGRLSVDADFYNKISRDLLANVEVDPSVGWSSIYKNSAKVSNRGIDLTLYGKLLDYKNVKWDATFQFSFNKNKVVSLSYTPTLSGAYKGSPIKGQPIGHIAVHRYGGLDENGEPMFMKKGDDTRYAYEGLGSLTIDDLCFVGRSTPPFFGSFSTNVSFHDFTLGLMLTYRLGNKMRLPTPRPYMFGNFTEWYSEENRWVEGQDNTHKWIPSYFPGLFGEPDNRPECLGRSDRLVANGGIIRLKSVSLEYDATRLLKKAGLKGGALRVSGENLAFWAANRYDLDPDQISISGADNSTVCGLAIKPRMVVSLNINF